MRKFHFSPNLEIFGITVSNLKYLHSTLSKNEGLKIILNNVLRSLGEDVINEALDT